MSERVLLWDVMGTLVRDPFPDDVAAHFGLTPKELLEQKDPHAWIDFERGTLDEAELLHRFFSDRRAIDGAAFKRCLASGYAWLPGIDALLGALQAARVEMHAASNYPPWYRLLDDALALGMRLRWTGVSCDLGVRKPDDAFFVRLLERVRRPASACVFVDDKPVNCDAARALGITAVEFTSAAALRTRLAEWFPLAR